MNVVNFCGNDFIFNSDAIHNYLLEKGIIISMLESDKINLDKNFDVINNAYILLLDVADNIDNYDIVNDEFKFLENCCDELVNREIVNIARDSNNLDDKKNKLLNLLDKIERLASKYSNLELFLKTDILKISNVIDDTIMYKLIAI